MNRIASLVVFGGLALSASSALATNYTVNWLDMSPTAIGSPVPNGSTFVLPGAGLVTMTYSIPATFSQGRNSNPLFQNGSITTGGDTYSWTNQELLGATNLVSSNPVVTTQWRVVYNFATPQPAGSIVVGVAGLGSTTSFGGGTSTAIVNMVGATVGEWGGGGNYGPNVIFNSGTTFTLNNSLSAPGGQDPHWNTPLAVMYNTTLISSISVEINALSGDGIGVSIGSVVPSPAASALAGLGLLVAARRRR